MLGKDVMLCGGDVIERCQDNRSFQRDITVKVSSPCDVIRVSLETAGKKWPISKCPYRVEDLVQDQNVSWNDRASLKFSSAQEKPHSWTGVDTRVSQYLSFY
jgi:hypothetical protein